MSIADAFTRGQETEDKAEKRQRVLDILNRYDNGSLISVMSVKRLTGEARRFVFSRRAGTGGKDVMTYGLVAVYDENAGGQVRNICLDGVKDIEVSGHRFDFEGEDLPSLPKDWSDIDDYRLA